jgi:PKHD-type hydroxylase
VIVHIQAVLNEEQVAHCREVMNRANWVDGRITAGYQSSVVKDNRQLPENSPEARELGDMIVTALERNPLFITAALPLRVFPPLFNRYEGGENFGAHLDNSIRQIPGTPYRIRTDVSATLFLSNPADYDGGELVIDDIYGAHSAKLPAGDMIVYPANSLHHVNAVTPAYGWRRFSGSKAWCGTTASARCFSSLTCRSTRSIKRCRITLG